MASLERLGVLGLATVLLALILAAGVIRVAWGDQAVLQWIAPDPILLDKAP